MKVIAINGSPRKDGNTTSMLDHALKGVLHREEKRNLSIFMI